MPDTAALPSTPGPAQGVLAEAAVAGGVEAPAVGLHPAPERCPNCNEPRAGRFCSGCGQRATAGRLTLRSLWGEFASRVFNLDRGLLHTATSLARAPGSVPRDYVEGRRRTYTNPLSFFLIAATLSLLSYGLYDDALIAQLTDGSFGAGIADGYAHPEDAATPPAVHDTTPEAADREARLDAALDAMMRDGGAPMMEVMFEGMIRYNTPLTLLLALFLVPPMRILFGDARNVAEASVFALYVVGFAVALGAVLAVPLVLGLGAVGSLVWTIAAAVVYIGFAAWGAVGFYPDEGALGAALRGGAAMAASYAAYFAVAVLFGTAYVITRVFHNAGEDWASVLRAVLS